MKRLNLQKKLRKNKKDGKKLPRSLHILIAEDNDLNAEILSELLMARGHTVEHACDGAEVVEMFEASPEHSFDLILMDVQMPKQNGYQATEMIRRLDRKDAQSIPIFACTANTMREDMEMAEKSGMDDFIGKPVDVVRLNAKLEEIASGSR